MSKSAFDHARDYLYSFRSDKDYFSQGGKGFTFERVKHFAKLLGDPQNKIRVIHVAGTSGKGSTCTIISKLLCAHGKKVGMSLSPHLIDMRERIQIDNALISREKFLAYFEAIRPYIHQMDTKKYGQLTFFEIMIVFAYYVFWKEKVDFAVMETGLGGEYDATNVATAQNKIAVITRLGLDHTDMLGNTIASIARAKAGIIHRRNLVITFKQKPSAQKVIGAVTEESKSSIIEICKDKNFSHIAPHDEGIKFDFTYGSYRWKNLTLSIPASYQAENASLALATCIEACFRSKVVPHEETIRKTLAQIQTPGRYQQVMVQGKHLIIDGAHNPQKMSTFIKSLKSRYPGHNFDFLIGFKKGKDVASMLKYISSCAEEIFITEFSGDDQARMIEAEKTQIITRILENKYRFRRTHSFHEPSDALNSALLNHDRILVITGSLYMISAVLQLSPLQHSF